MLLIEVADSSTGRSESAANDWGPDPGSGHSSSSRTGRTTIYGEEPPSRQWNLRLRGEASAKLDDPQGGVAVTREREMDLLNDGTLNNALAGWTGASWSYK